MYRIYFDCGREKAITRTHVRASRLASRKVGVEFLGRHVRCNGSRQAAIPRRSVELAAAGTPLPQQWQYAWIQYRVESAADAIRVWSARALRMPDRRLTVPQIYPSSEDCSLGIKKGQCRNGWALFPIEVVTDHSPIYGSKPQGCATCAYRASPAW